MTRFEPIEPELIEAAQMSVLRIKEAALRQLAEDMGVEPSELMAPTTEEPIDLTDEDAVRQLLEECQDVTEPVPADVVDEPLEEESNEEDADAAQYDMWASELLGE